MADALGAKLAAGGLSCMLVSFVLNPVDVLKTRLQVQAKAPPALRRYKGFMHGFRVLLREEGAPGLLRGITASMVRELAYSSIRLGLYDPAKSLFVSPDVPPGDVSLPSKIMAGLLSGGVGSCLATPTDVVKIRFQARLPEEPRVYRNSFHALITIFKNEGVRGLYRGVGPTMARAAVLTSAQLSSYDHTKHALLRRQFVPDGPRLHVACALVAGLVTATATCPVDVIKTRLMSAPSGTYTNALHCLTTSVARDGLAVLMRGWLPNYFRLGPHFIVSLPLYEYLRRQFGAGYM